MKVPGRVVVLEEEVNVRVTVDDEIGEVEVVEEDGDEVVEREVLGMVDVAAIVVEVEEEEAVEVVAENCRSDGK